PTAAGTVAGFLDPGARLDGVGAGGGRAMGFGRVGVMHGFRSMVLQDEHGQVCEAHSSAAGLGYPGIGPEQPYLGDIGRARYVTVNDDEVVEAVVRLARTEGIFAALESAHALAWIIRAAGSGELPAGANVLMTLSGRGDKDVSALMEAR